MPDRSKTRGQTKFSPRSSMLGVGHGAENHTSENFTVTKSRRRPRSTQGCNVNKEEELFLAVKA
jgi:hypothetical protein